MFPGTWRKICFFQPRTSDAYARELAQLGFDWGGLEGIAFHRGSDHYAAMIVANADSVVEWADLPESIAVIENSFCVDREHAVLRHAKPAHDDLGPTLAPKPSSAPLPNRAGSPLRRRGS